MVIPCCQLVTWLPPDSGTWKETQGENGLCLADLLSFGSQGKHKFDRSVETIDASFNIARWSEED